MPFSLFAAGMALGAIPAAQNHSSIPGFLMVKPPTIDGKIGPEEWKGAPTVEGGFDEKTGEASKQRMKFWLAYDSKYIYFAADLEEKDPKNIHATETRTNVAFDGDDWVALAIDPFGTGTDLNRFDVNPLGTTHIRMSGGRAAKREWMGDFTGGASRTPDGWQIEARIPWGIMQLPSSGKRTLRLTFVRWCQGTQRSFETDDISAQNLSNVARWVDVEVPKPDDQRILKLLPYTYAGATKKQGIFNSGLDLKTEMTDSLELVGSANPDFRNIENQILSLDFSYFERLASESRPFFLEGAQYFQTSRDAPLFSSQRIKSFDAGLKAYGKVGDRLTVAALDTIDFGNQNAMAMATKYTVNEKLSFTAAATDLQTKGNSNTGSFLSSNYSIGPYQAFGQYMTTQDTEDGFGHRINTGVYYSKAGWNNGFEYVEISPGFHPRLGFAPQRGFRGWTGILYYEKPLPKGPIATWSVSANGNYWNKFDGSLYDKALDLQGSVALRESTELTAGAHFEKFDSNNDHVYFLILDRPRDDIYRNWKLNYTWGTIEGIRYQSIGPQINLRPLRGLQLTGTYQSVQHGDRSDQAILSVSYQLNPNEAISGRAVRQGNQTNAYLSFRHSGNRGIEYFIILGDPNAKTFQSSLILKVVIPLEIKY